MNIPYCDMEWLATSFVRFDHDEVTINSFGETLDKATCGSYSKQRAAVIQQMVAQIRAEEDAEIFRILDSIAQSGNNDI